MHTPATDNSTNSTEASETVLLSDEPEIRRSLSVMLRPGHVYELRTVGKTWSGYFDDFDKMAEEAACLSGADGIEGVYCTINPCDPNLLARAANRVKWAKPGNTTSDREIVRRFTFLIDVDSATRPTGISATEEEKKKTLVKALEVKEYLESRGWPKPLFADSGNGNHLRFRVDLPNDERSKQLLGNCLAALAAEFNDGDNKIDTKVFNASRICKIYGTLAAKGDDVPSRPHRICCILEEGDSANATLEQLQALADDYTPTKAGAKAAQTSGVKRGGLVISNLRYRYTPEEIEALLDAYGVERSEKMDYEKGFKWQITCIFDPSHRKPDAVVYLHPSDDGYTFASENCSHDSCKGRGWKEFVKKLREQNPDLDEDWFRDNHEEAIVISGGALNEAVLKAETVLINTDELKYFCRGSDLVKPVQFEKLKIAGLERADESVVVQPVSPYTIIRDVNECAKCINEKGNPTTFTANLAAHVLDRVRAGQAAYRPLDMVTSSPVLLPDGTVLAKPGYSNGILFVGEAQEYPSVPESPTQGDAKSALRKFEAVYREFPFVRDSKEDWRATPSYATVLASILGIVARPALTTVPLIGVSANTPGTGKTKIVESAVIAAVGHKPTVVSFSGEEEFSKALVPLLREGDRATLIDNVSIPLTGDMLCSVLTSEEHRARILGQSEQVRLLNKTTFFATGNNLAIQGDLTRRAAQVELDANCERPEQRKFDFDPVILAQKLHSELCIAALTALRAYILAGKPWLLDRAVMGSFEEWDRLVCGCLVWCGFADPALTARQVIESDPERESNLELYNTWYDTYNAPVSLTQIVTDKKPVYDILAGGAEWNPRAVGRRLRKLDKRTIEGLKLASTSPRDGYRRYYVTKNGKFNPEAKWPPRVQVGSATMGSSAEGF